jgi:uncharacterized protein
MDVRPVDDPERFLEESSPLLLEGEARHNLMLGLAGILASTPDVFPGFRLWTVREDDAIVGAALRTPPHNLVVARPRFSGVTDALAAALHAEGHELPGVVGALPEVTEFAEAWARHAAVRAGMHMSQGIYQVRSVRRVPGVPGEMREARSRDRDLLVRWTTDFSSEARGDPEAAGTEEDIDRRLQGKGGRYLLWEDPDPVSLAGYGGATPNGVRIGPVFTPPDVRGRGYAGALVGEVSARLIEEGHRFCFLYTDLSNPISNRLYRRLGYELVCESAEYTFDR